MRSRPGYTLVEVLIAGTLGVIILSLTAPLTALLLQQQQGDPAVDANWSRLADQVRRDIHAASRVEPLPAAKGPASEVEFVLADGSRAHYDGTRAALRRVWSRDAQTAHDTYYLPEGSTIRWTKLPAERGELAELLIQYPVANAPDARRALKISAALGRDLRWESPR